MGYSPWDHKESDTTEQLTLQVSQEVKGSRKSTVKSSPQALEYLALDKPFGHNLLFQHPALSHLSAPCRMIQGPQRIQFQSSPSYSKRFTQPEEEAVLPSAPWAFLSPSPPLKSNTIREATSCVPSLPTTKRVPTAAFLQSLNQASQLRSLQLLLTLEITAGSEKQITPCNQPTGPSEKMQSKQPVCDHSAPPCPRPPPGWQWVTGSN